MPEGDTVYAAASRLRAVLEGRRLVSSQFRIPSLATADLSGRDVVAVRSRGKHLLIDVDESTPGAGDAVSVHSHLKMEGVWHCLLYTSPSPRDRTRSRMPSSA